MCFIYVSRVSFSSPESTILLACGRDRELWLVPNQEVRESQTSNSSTQTQKFETKVVANGYKNAPSLRLHIFRNWPELSILPAEDRGLWGRECMRLWQVKTVLRISGTSLVLLIAMFLVYKHWRHIFFDIQICQPPNNSMHCFNSQ